MYVYIYSCIYLALIRPVRDMCIDVHSCLHQNFDHLLREGERERERERKRERKRERNERERERDVSLCVCVEAGCACVKCVL